MAKNINNKLRDCPILIRVMAHAPLWLVNIADREVLASKHGFVTNRIVVLQHSPVRISVGANRERKVLLTLTHLLGDAMFIFKNLRKGKQGRKQATRSRSRNHVNSTFKTYCSLR